MIIIIISAAWFLTGLTVGALWTSHVPIAEQNEQLQREIEAIASRIPNTHFVITTKTAEARWAAHADEVQASYAATVTTKTAEAGR